MYKRMHTSEHVHVRVTLDVIPRQTPTSFRETGFSLGPGAHPWVKLVLTKGPQYTSSALGLQRVPYVYLAFITGELGLKLGSSCVQS